jgi:hypothetical protein
VICHGFLYVYQAGYVFLDLHRDSGVATGTTPNRRSSRWNPQTTDGWRNSQRDPKRFGKCNQSSFVTPMLGSTILFCDV